MCKHGGVPLLLSASMDLMVCCSAQHAIGNIEERAIFDSQPKQYNITHAICFLMVIISSPCLF